ncbi:hypothetical protein [Roseibium sp. M-1]
MSSLETGKVLPTVPEICALSLIFGRTFESLFGAVFEDIRTDLKARLATLPTRNRNWLERFNRKHTLNSLAERLEAKHSHRV